MRILVVDDELDICEILKYNLETEGFEVDTAYSAEEALELARKESGNNDLKMSDLHQDEDADQDLTKARNFPLLSSELTAVIIELPNQSRGYFLCRLLRLLSMVLVY